jgi:GH15 family glucan-1,4-alpha-glucosidase
VGEADAVTSPSTPRDGAHGAGGGVPDTDVSAYADLRDYAALGDGRTVALITTGGSVDWWPVPDLDSLPVFAALLDAEDGGRLELAPTTEWTAEREYLAATNVLSTTYRTPTGRARVVDSLNSGVAGRLPWAELARRVDGLEGEVRFAWRVRPGTGLGAYSPWIQRTAHGPVMRIDRVMMAVRCRNAGQEALEEQQISGGFATAPGSRHVIGVIGTHDEPLNMPRPQEIDARVELSVKGWEQWSSQVQYDGRWKVPVARSALALKLLLLSPTGATAAAATTSLPESWAGGKNWDYRYAWVRDMAYTLGTLLRLGLREEIQAAVAWLLHTIRRHYPHLSVFYRLNGDLPGERTYADVPGWRGVGPVITGNHAAQQLQLGVFGDFFSVIRQYVEAGHVLDVETGRLLSALADQCCDQWQRRDAGIWELQDEHHYTSSKMGCWQALDCAVAIAELGMMPGDVGRWRAERDRIRVWVNQRCWSEDKQSYTWYAGSEDLDASVLPAARFGFDRGRRMSRTIDAVRRELGHDGSPLLHRYAGMAKEEGAFVACSFWLVSALAAVGRTDEAADVLDRLIGMANDVGLYSEMIDVASGEFLGNFPQGLSHLTLIEAVLDVEEAQGT